MESSPECSLDGHRLRSPILHHFDSMRSRSSLWLVCLGRCSRTEILHCPECNSCNYCTHQLLLFHVFTHQDAWTDKVDRSGCTCSRNRTAAIQCSLVLGSRPCCIRCSIQVYRHSYWPHSNCLPLAAFFLIVTALRVDKGVNEYE